MLDKVSYLKDFSHCGVSPYVMLVTIATVNPAKNSDNLEILTFEETARFALTQRGQYKPGDKVMFIPADSILPLELSEALNVTKYTANGRVKVAKLRGNRSEGLVVSADIVEPFLPYILKWEDLPTIQMGGNPYSTANVALEFERFYRIPNLLDKPKLFEIGEPIYYSEKIHGVNGRFGYLPNPNTGEYEFYVGSHEMVLKGDDDNLYWMVVRRELTKAGIYPDKLDWIMNKVFYVEIFGYNVQHLHYGKKVPAMRVIAIAEHYKYKDINMVKILCDEIGLPVVDIHETKFTTIDELREIAESPSELTDSHIREGIVVVSAINPEKMAKLISFKYLLQQDRTERH